MSHRNIGFPARQHPLLAGLAALGLIAGSSHALAQHAASPVAEATSPAADVLVPQPGVPFTEQTAEGFPYLDATNLYNSLTTTYGRSPSPLTKLMRELAEAKDDATKDKLVEQLHKLLGEEYDRSLAGHEKSLDKMEERLEKLREQLSKRRSAKSKVVDLRIQQLLNESEGLGWPGPSPGSNTLQWREQRDPFGFMNADPATRYGVAVPPVPAIAPAAPTPPPSRSP
jgi:hypothetical protein